MTRSSQMIESLPNPGRFKLLSERVASQLEVAEARSLDPQGAAPVLWQKVRYHGSLTQRHGIYWVEAIHALTSPFGLGATLRFDLCELRDGMPVAVVANARRESLTLLPEHRSTV